MTASFPFEEHTDIDRNGLTRRRLLISIGAGCCGCLVGHFAFRVGEHTGPTSSAGAARAPRLRQDVVFGSENGLVTLRRRDATSEEYCAVNGEGAAVIRSLDGSRDIPEIARELALKAGVEPNETLDAKVAYFVAQVGEMGLLAEPFYACLYEVKVV